MPNTALIRGDFMKRCILCALPGGLLMYSVIIMTVIEEGLVGVTNGGVGDWTVVRGGRIGTGGSK